MTPHVVALEVGVQALNVECLCEDDDNKQHDVESQEYRCRPHVPDCVSRRESPIIEIVRQGLVVIVESEEKVIYNV